MAVAPAPKPHGQTDRQRRLERDGGFPTWLIVLFLLALLLAAGYWFFRGRSNRATFKERATQEDLGKQASALLLATDDALRSADQEVGFAQAQFGDAEAAPFQKALDDAKAELRQAFLISQQLDDDKPETPDQRHAMLQEIIDRCTRAQGMVNDQLARIKTLRDLVKNVDQVLPQTEHRGRHPGGPDRAGEGGARHAGDPFRAREHRGRGGQSGRRRHKARRREGLPGRSIHRPRRERPRYGGAAGPGGGDRHDGGVRPAGCRRCDAGGARPERDRSWRPRSPRCSRTSPRLAPR